MYIKIFSDEFNIDFQFQRRITFLRGNSGIGKTTITEYIMDNSFDIQKDFSLPVIVVNDTNWETLIASSKSSILIFDDMYVILGPLFARLCKEYLVANDLYLILICREGLEDTTGDFTKQLSYSVDSILTLANDNAGNYWTEPFYSFQSVSSCDIVVTEDSQAGFMFFNHLFKQKGIRTISSSSGKSSIVNDIIQLSPDFKVLAIIDMSAYGCHIEEFYQRLILGRGNVFLMPDIESFEEVLLQSNMLKDKHEVQKVFSNLKSYANQYISWETFFSEFLYAVTRKSLYRQSHKASLCKCYYKECSVCKSTNVYVFNKCDFVGKNLPNKMSNLLKGTKHQNLLGIHKRVSGKNVGKAAIEKIDLF